MPARLRIALCFVALSFAFRPSAFAQSCSIPPGAIPNFHTVSLSSTSWTIGWNAPAGAPAGTQYDVWQKKGTSYCVFGQASLAGTTTNTTFTVPIDISNITYGLFVVLHTDSCQITQYTLVIDTFTTPPSQPPKPTATVSGNSVTLTFSYTDGRSFDVEIFRAGSDGLFNRQDSVQTCPSDPKSWTDTNVPNGVYQYKLGTWNNANATTSDIFSDPVTVTVGSVAPSILSFAATPPTIRAGQSAVLSYVTQNATSVSIDQGVSASGSSGSVTVTPKSTTTYTLTAMNGAQTRTASVTVNVITAPSVAVSSFPSAIVQTQGSGGGTTQYTLTNAGGSSTTISLGQSGTFFTQSPSSFTLAAGASQTITITGTAQGGGVQNGFSIPSGSGVPSGLQIPISLLSTAPPAGPVSAAPTTNRVDIAGDAGTTSGGTVSFANSGSATLTGILVSDVPWLIPQSGIVSIPPNSTASFTFTIDRTKRGDATAPVGSVAGRISLVYLSGPAPLGKTGVPFDNTTPSVSTVSVVDTVKPAVGTGAAPAISPGEVALFVPGVGHVQGGVNLFISDLSIVNPPGNHAISDLKMYYMPIGGSAATQKTATMPSISTVNVGVADVANNVFGATGQIGTLQLRSADAAKLGIGAAISVVNKSTGTFGNSIPIFRSDRGVGSGGSLVLSGLQQNPGTAHTNLFIQETSGAGAVQVSTQFLAANGTTLGTRSDTVNAFGLGLISSTVVPTGAVAAIMTNSGAAAGSFLAYATPVDELSGDSWSVVDWSRQYAYSANAATVIPVAGVVHGNLNTFFRTDVSITNTGSASGTGTLRYLPQGGSPIDKQITLGGHQTNIIADVVGSYFNATSTPIGFLIFTPVAGGTFAMTSRTYTTASNQPGTFGTGVPALAQASALQLGGVRAIGSIEDASPATVSAKTPGTFRTNYGIVETSGNPVTVNVTLRFQYPAGLYTTAVGTASKLVTLQAYEFKSLVPLASDILGSARASLGDLRGVEVDFQVISGTGAISVFTSSVDNGSGDSTLRTE